ncbi:hypothetical protein [Congregibacter litoralis]|uniref:Apea-like HEPN domain-containing protein n=1 Tax=Congregibacter litoralis KT71 TaxID=314285 RepID=A4ADH4_9GAMM|nr:hypothetical protein [Congregibacter litoralis]EAQ95972.1 hypothetical protein KT71_18252 [Congregibacter litoralis KT71]
MYKLRIPFKLAMGQKLNIENEQGEYVAFGDLQAHVEFTGHFWVLTLRGFESDADAEGFFDWIRVGFDWWLLERGMAATYPLEIDPIHRPEDPEAAGENLGRAFGVPEEDRGRVDGVVSGNRPAVFPVDEHIKVFTAGPATVTMGNTSTQFLEHIRDALLRGGADARASESLRTALDLYAGFFSESSSNAKFLSLMMVLEVLAGDRLRNADEMEARATAADVVETLIKGEESAIDDCLQHAANGLRGSRMSHTQAIQSMVSEILASAGRPEDEVKAAVREAKELYRLRGNLVHNGILDPRHRERLIDRSRELVSVLLHCCFEREVIGGQ